MRYEVPQFIEVEQKIIGPFTWRQFVYLAGGIGAVVITFLTLPFIFFLVTGVPIAILSVMLAFQKVNNRPFAALLEAGFNFFTRRKMYVWSMDPSRKYTVVAKPQEPVAQSDREAAAPAIRPSGNLSALTERLAQDDSPVREV